MILMIIVATVLANVGTDVNRDKLHCLFTHCAAPGDVQASLFVHHVTQSQHFAGKKKVDNMKSLVTLKSLWVKLHI